MMKKVFLVFCFFIMQLLAHGQNELKNVYSYWHEVLGGMEDGGIDRSEAYVFVASKTIKIKDIYFEDKEIELKKGDTLQINVRSFKPYNSHRSTGDNNTKKPEQPELKKRFKVIKQNNIYYANVMYPYEWSKKIEFVRKRNTYSVSAKKEFDKGKQDAAP